MATTVQQVTTSPTAIANLTQGTDYTIQYQGIGYVYVAQAAAAPNANTTAKLRYLNDERVTIDMPAGESIYIWGDAINQGQISVVEAVT